MTSVAQGVAGTRRVVPEVVLPAAVLGNGSLLATVSATGRLERVTWPHVDWAPHLGELRLGIARAASTTWLDDDELEHEQRYLDGALAVETHTRVDEVVVEVTDVVAPDAPVLMPHVRSAPSALRVVVYCRPTLGERERYGAAYVDGSVLVFYCREFALALSLAPGASATCGRTAPGEQSLLYTHALAAQLDRADVAHGVVDGALVAPLEGEVTLVAAFGSTPDEALARVRENADVGRLLAARRRHDGSRAASIESPLPVADGVEALYRRSIDVFDLLTDRESGAMIAAPEVDPDFVYSGGYGFVWARDLAYGVLAALACGRGDLATGALRSLARNQSEQGFWAQRHWTDGRVAPSWCEHQLDETGSALHAFDVAWRELGDEELDASLWPAARRAANFLCDWRDESTGLPLPSHDLWEEREGVHAYTVAATVAGLRAAAAMAERHEPARAPTYAEAAEQMRAALERELWLEREHRYARSLGDDTVDVSLLGLAWPFGVVDPRGDRMRATARAIRDELGLEDGGLRRYAADTYAGGNAWILAALWFGLWERQAGAEGHERAVEYAVARQTAHGFLPEQVGPDGSPTWVVPLAWSHAMFVLAVRPELALHS